MRYEDPNGDFGRQDRQKQFIQGVMHEGASVKSLDYYRSIFYDLGDNVQTNMTFNEIMDAQKNYRDVVGPVDQLYFEEGTGGKMDNCIWYYHMNDAELAEKQALLKEHLELKE